MGIGRSFKPRVDGEEMPRWRCSGGRRISLIYAYLSLEQLMTRGRLGM
jgi:hypothetical protein